jgi:NADH dehydrogenase
MLGVGHDVSSLVRNGSEEKVQDATRVQIVPGDIASKASLRELIKGCDAVIYNVGILRESPRQGVTFEATQYEGVVNAVDAALDVRVRRFLLMSANGVKVPGTTYQETKFRAEEYALRSGLDVTVFRPSVIFGDPHGKMEFATQLFREMVRPPVPAVSFFSGRDPKQGAVVMSPVHITDVAAAFLVALENVDSIGKIYALGGPETLTWKQMISRIAAATGRRKWFVPMPIGLMRVGATLFDWLPFFPVTRDQLTMLEDPVRRRQPGLSRRVGRNVQLHLHTESTPIGALEALP